MKDEFVACTAFSCGWCWTIRPPALPGSSDALGSVAGRAHSPSDGGVCPEPHQHFQRTQSCWISQAVVLMLINFWKNKERRGVPPLSGVVPPLPGASPLAELTLGARGAVLLFADTPCSSWGFSQGLQRAQGLLGPCRKSCSSHCSCVAFLMCVPHCRMFGCEDRKLLPWGMTLPPQLPSHLNALMLSVISTPRVPPALWVAVCACCQTDLCENTEFLILFVLK